MAAVATVVVAKEEVRVEEVMAVEKEVALALAGFAVVAEMVRAAWAAEARPEPPDGPGRPMGRRRETGKGWPFFHLVPCWPGSRGKCARPHQSRRSRARGAVAARRET